MIIPGYLVLLRKEDRDSWEVAQRAQSDRYWSTTNEPAVVKKARQTVFEYFNSLARTYTSQLHHLLPLPRNLKKERNGGWAGNVRYHHHAIRDENLKRAEK